MSIYQIEKISYSKVGVTHVGLPRKVNYIPIVSLIHDEKGTIKSKIYLEKMVESKKYYTGWIEGKTYIAGITNDGNQKNVLFACKTTGLTNQMADDIIVLINSSET